MKIAIISIFKVWMTAMTKSNRCVVLFVTLTAKKKDKIKLLNVLFSFVTWRSFCVNVKDTLQQNSPIFPGTVPTLWTHRDACSRLY